ncbi:MAG: DNA-binding response regulator [Coleofasciculus sp. S288]|nr:DNA-binding response regulator [Coleofasciculus sp. S288]
MMEPEQLQEILDLRARNLTPKQIARKLGLKVAEVSAVIKEQAEQTTLIRAASGELDPIAECLVNASCVERFFNNSAEEPEDEMNSSLVLVSVARQVANNRLTVCTYLVDLWCLGVKDTMGPRRLDRADYKQAMSNVYRYFPDEPLAITLEQAQAVVFSGVEYAAQLGFSPHSDFEKTRSHLGKWSGEPKIQCGRNGKPFYVSGPYDNPMKILKTLREKVGEENFDYLMGME